MKITPLEIRQHEFEKTFRGYNIEEVDNYLNNLAQEWERVINESKMMRMQLEIAEKDANKLREIEMTLFKTLKTAEDTSTMITEQANQQADKYLYDSKIEAEQILTSAEKRAADIIKKAEEKANYVKEELLGDIKALETNFRTMEQQKNNLLIQMRSLSSETLDHVQRFENKFNKEGVENKFSEAKAILIQEETLLPIIEEKIIDTPAITEVEKEAIVEEIKEIPFEIENKLETEIIELPLIETEPIVETKNEIVEAVVEKPIEAIIVEKEIHIEPQLSIADEVDLKVENTTEDNLKTESLTSISAVENLTADNLALETETGEKPNSVKENANRNNIDELEIIEGIGPKIADLLRDKGIHTFRDLAITPIYKIEDILQLGGPKYAMHDPTTWPQQAKLAAEERWEDLNALKSYLFAGKDLNINSTEVSTTENITNLTEEPIVEVKETISQELLENKPDSITEEMLDKVNKVKAAVRKAMVEKNDLPTKDNSPLPTLNDIIGKTNEGGSFFDNL